MPLELEELTGKIIGAAIEVHRVLGPGFIESIYENALVLELLPLGLKTDQQYEVAVKYRGKPVGLHRVDLFIDSRVVVELKTVREFDDIHFVVVRSYLRALGLKHGLLLNFAKEKLEVKRVICD
jgi:GxxExxY protein